MVARTRGGRSRSKSPARPQATASRISARIASKAAEKSTPKSNETEKTSKKSVSEKNGFSLSELMKTLGPEVRFCLYLVGLYTTFLYWGLVQEKLTSNNTRYVSDRDGSTVKWSYPLALNMGMALSAWVTTIIFESVVWKSPKKVNWKHFWKAAATSAVASPLGYASLQYISFPLMILTKSCKPIPVMVIGFFRYAVRYPWYKYISVALLSLGIAIFCAYQPPKAGSSGTSSGPSDWTDISVPFTDLSFSLPTLGLGIVLVLMNLTLDGFTNNEQDFLFKKYNATSIQMMGNVNLWQFIYLGSYLLLWLPFEGKGSEIYKAVVAIMSSSKLCTDIFMFFVCAAVGQLLIFTVMEEFGSLTWVTIGITRKMFTIILSVIMYNHNFNMYMWAGVALVFVGMFLEVYKKYSDGGDVKKKDSKKK